MTVMLNAGLEYIVNVQDKLGSEDEGLEAWVFKQWKYSTVEWLLRERSWKSSVVLVYPVIVLPAERERDPGSPVLS